MLWIWKLDPNPDLQSLIFKIYSQSGQLPSPQNHKAERWPLTSAITRNRMTSVGQQMTLNSTRQLPINSTHLHENYATLSCIYRNPGGTPSRRVSQTVGRRMPAQKRNLTNQAAILLRLSPSRNTASEWNEFIKLQSIFQRLLTLGTTLPLTG